jgi:molybdenum cofactor cytidylyltransferase
MIAAVVLAAGGSRRLGRPKQLVQHRGRSLVRNAAAAALGAGCDPVVVVLGASVDEVGPEIEELPVQPIVNDEWATGMASSIREGVRTVREEAPEVAGVLLLACDQPHIDAEILSRLVDAFDGRPGSRVAAGYAGSCGIPALFERSLFEGLERLEGDRGARSLLFAEPGDRLQVVPWPEGEIDVDLPGDI